MVSKSWCPSHGVQVMEAIMRCFMHHAPLGEEDGANLGASSAEQVEETLIACEAVRGQMTLWKALKTVERLQGSSSLAEVPSLKHVVLLHKIEIVNRAGSKVTICLSILA